MFSVYISQYNICMDIFNCFGIRFIQGKWNIVTSRFFIFIFSIVAVRFYGENANTPGEKAFIVAFNLATIPFLIANILATSYCFNHGGILGEGMDAYMVTFFYSPVIFGASFFLLYIIFKLID